MAETEDGAGGSVAWVADTGLFVACGRQDNEKYAALSRFVRRRELVLHIPRQVHEELGGAPERSSPASLPIDAAIEEGWVTVVDLDYTDPTVSAVVDDARRFIANASNRDEDRIERADTALAGVAMTLLQGDTTAVRLVTTDRDAGAATARVLESHGFGGQVEVQDGFELLADIS